MHENLAKLCRICFGEGEYNLWEYKVQLPAEVIDDEENKESALEKELSVHQMLNSFYKEQPSEESNVEVAVVHLICHYCLDELVPSYLFYRKIKQADKKLAAYLNDLAVETETNSAEQSVEYLEEEVTVQREVTEDVEEVLLEAQNESENKVEEFGVCSETALVRVGAAEEEVSQNYVEILSDEQLPHVPIGNKRRKLAKNPKFVLTGGVTQMLSHVNHTSPESEPYDVPKRSFSATPSPQHVPLSQLKRLKTREREKAELEMGSFVVTQFIPSTTQLNMDTLFAGNAADKQEQSSLPDNPMAGNELRTMDYAAVEIDASGSELHVNETDAPHSMNDADSSAPTNQTIYFCKYCPQAFSGVNFLTTHMRKRHVCKFCTQGFSQSTQLYEHIRSAHNEHKCAICGKELSTHSNLRSHIKRVHGVKLPAQVALLDYRRHRVANESEEQNIETNLVESMTESANVDYIEIHKQEFEEQQDFIEL